MLDKRLIMAVIFAVTTAILAAGTTEEAARFFAEYQMQSRAGHYADARKKLDAAIALDPDKLDYQLAMLTLNKIDGRRGSVSSSMAMVEKNIKLAEEIDHKFSRHPDLYTYEYFDWNLEQKRQQMTSADRAKMARLAEIYRPRHQTEIQKRYYHFDLRDGINSFAEWAAYNRYELDAGRFNLYWNEKRWCDYNYRTALKNLELSRSFFLAHKNPPERDAAADWLSSMMMEYNQEITGAGWSSDRPLPNPAIKTAMDEMFRHSGEYTAKSADHPLSSIRECGRRLALFRRLVDGNYAESPFRQALREYVQQGKASGIPPDLSRDYMILSVIRLGNPALEKVLMEVSRETDTPAPGSVAIGAMTAAELSKAIRHGATPEEQAQTALRLAPQLIAVMPQAFTDPETNDLFVHLQRMTEQDGQNSRNPVFRQLEKAMNCNVTVKRLAALDSVKVPRHSGERQELAILTAAWQPDGLYLLLAQQLVNRRQISWQIRKFDLQTGRLKPVSAWTTWHEGYYQSSATFNVPPLALNGQWAAVGNEGNIYLLSLKSPKTRVISDLPGKTVMAIAILQNRIYAFLRDGSEDNARNTILFSCDWDGKNRSVLVATSRDVKQTDLDRRKPFQVYTMTGDEAKKRLVFNAATPNQTGGVDGVWEFYPETGQSKCLFNRQWKFMDPVMTRVDNRLFFSFFRQEHCIYDLATDHGEVFFSTENRQARNYFKVKFRPSQFISYPGPFFARDRQIWFGGDCHVKLIALPDASRSQWVFLPYDDLLYNSARLIFPHPDGISVLTIDEGSVYQITPKEGTQR